MAETRDTLMADIENLYGPLKALSEAEAEKHFPGMTTIIRPGYIIGPRDPMQVIDDRDLAEWISVAARR